MFPYLIDELSSFYNEFGEICLREGFFSCNPLPPPAPPELGDSFATSSPAALLALNDSEVASRMRVLAM